MVLKPDIWRVFPGVASVLPFAPESLRFAYKMQFILFLQKKVELAPFCVGKCCHTGGNTYIQLWILSKSIWGSQEDLPSDAAKYSCWIIPKSLSFLLLLLWLISMVAMSTLHFPSRGFVWLSGVTEFMIWSVCRFKRYLYILQCVPAFFTSLRRNISFSHIIQVG